MNFVEATAEDTDTLAHLIRAFYDEEPDLQLFDPEESRRRAAEIISLSNNLIFPLLVRQGDQVIGHALMVPYYSNEFGGLLVMLDEFFILPEYRSHGVGGEAIEKLKAWAVDQGYCGMTLEITDANSKALPFYERHGFAVPPRKIMYWFPEQWTRKTPGDCLAGKICGICRPEAENKP